MSVMLKEPITGPAAGVAADVQDDDSWVHVLSDVEIAGIDAAVSAAQADGVSYPKMTKRDVDFGFLELKFQGSVCIWACQLGRTHRVICLAM